MKIRAALLAIAMAALVGQAQAQRAQDDTVTLNFVNADIEAVVKAVSEITGKNFVLDPRVKGTINIVSARPIARAMVYDVFRSALRLQGYAVIEDQSGIGDGGLVKIIPEADAKLHPGRTVGPNERLRATGDQIQTQVFTLKYESAAQLLPILRPLIAPANTITVYPASNSLVVTDYAGNLQRIGRIIDSIDQPSGTDPVVIPLQHASAVDVAQVVGRLFADAPQAAGAPGADTSQRLSVVADPRSNSLIARSDNPSRITRLRTLVAMLDSPTSAAGNLHVVYLKNAEAVKVAETLRAIYLGETVAAAAPRSMLLPVAASSAGTPPLAPPALAGPQAGALSPGMIQADPATNSVLINAPDAIYNNLRAALDKLDVRRAQVYVEALIAEITADKAAEFGIQWQSLSGVEKSGTNAFGGTNFGGPGQNVQGIAANPAIAGRGLNIGVINGVVNIPGVGEVLNLNLLIRALETDSNANILSTPTLLTLDNEEAKIVIGQNVPFITGSYAVTGAATTPTPFQTIERKDVGLTLRVKPQINEGGTVRLQIYQEVSSVVDTILPNPAGVTTNKRSVESMVLVDDGQIVVIGGLIQDSVKDGVEKVPLLGDIPFLGALFTYKTRSRTKTNLMVFLRPTVLRDAQRAASLTGSRYDYILGEQYKAAPPPSPPLPDMEPPSLPPR
jgi:general secretion pathway protein D